MIHLLLGFDDRWLAKTLTQTSAHWYSWQTCLIVMHCSQKTFHLLSVSNGPASILSNISVNLRKSLESIFVGYFWKITNICERRFWDVSEMSRNRHLSEICSRHLKDVTQKASILRCFWDVLKTSQKRHLFEIYLVFLFEMNLRRLKDFTKKLSLLRCFWEISEMSLSMEI